jgi:hypothetical protein
VLAPPRGLGGLQALAHRFHKRATPQNALITQVRLPTTAQLRDGLPSAEASEEAPTLELGAAPLRDSRRYECAVGATGPAARCGELPKNGRRILPGARHSAE